MSGTNPQRNRAQYGPSSRLAARGPRRPRCDAAFRHGRLVLSAVGLLCICMSGCRQPEPSRGQQQAWADGPVTIATAWPWQSRKTLLYGQGLQMAVDEINAAGGVLGRPLTVLR